MSQNNPIMRENLEASMFRMLGEDILLAQEALEREDSQANRRSFIRTIFSAVEGYVSQLRDSVLSSLVELHSIPPAKILALTEKTYSVNEKGEFTEHSRYLSHAALLRLTVQVAKEFSESLDVDFGGGGWQKLQKASQARNRLTHPKIKSDLVVSDENIEDAWDGLIWLVQVCESVMRETQNTSIQYLEIVAGIRDGDPQILALYHEVLKRGIN